MSTKTIMFANQKGGVGKTTATFEISYIMSQSDKKILMIDLDAQCNLTHICGGKQEKGMTIYDTIMGNTAFSDAIQTVRENLDLLAGSRKMLSQYFVGAQDIYALKEAIEIICDDADYDLITIDVGPEGGQLMTMAMMASTYVIAVSDFGDLGYSGVMQMCADMAYNNDSFKNFNIKPLGILLSGARRTLVSAANRAKYEDLAPQFGAEPFEVEISQSCKMDECKEFKQAINEYDPKSAIAFQYFRLAEEIMARIDVLENPGKPKKGSETARLKGGKG